MVRNTALLASCACMGMLVALAALGQTQQCMEGCSAPLQGGVFNEDKINSSTSSKEAFHDWMCVAEFKDHNDAHNAGIDIGAIVYGVPIKLGGTWGDGQQDNWKKTQCTEQQRSAEKSSVYTRAIRTASPDILASWSKCVEIACAAGHPRLACEVSSVAGATMFKSSWLREIGEPAASAPKVLFYKAYDAQCDRSWSPGQQLTEAPKTFRCQPTADRDAVFILETDGGSCATSGNVLKAKEMLEGNINLSADRHIKAELISLSADTALTTNGYKLTLEATEIHVDGTPKIISFQAKDGRPAGENGRNAGAIIIKAAKITGTSIAIDNSGENGVAGANGAKGPPGPNGRQGTQRDWDFTGCHGGSNGTPGGTGGTGGDGSTGGRGGNGGAVVYSIGIGAVAGPIKRIDVATSKIGPDGAPINCGGTCGGHGAPGGSAGPGGDGGVGGAGAPGGHGGCGGTDAGPSAGPGASGRPGTDGADGSPGQVVVM